MATLKHTSASVSQTPRQIWEGLSESGQRALLSPEPSDSMYGYAEIEPLRLVSTIHSWEGRSTDLTALGRAVAVYGNAPHAEKDDTTT